MSTSRPRHARPTRVPRWLRRRLVSLTVTTALVAAVTQVATTSSTAPAPRPSTAKGSSSRSIHAQPVAFTLPTGCQVNGTNQNLVVCDFGYTGANLPFTVPSGVSVLTNVSLSGGAGGGHGGTDGAGNGGTVTGVLNVHGGQTLTVQVGGQGAEGRTGGWPDGGSGNTGSDGGSQNGCGGGGGSRIVDTVSGGQLVTAGGGGGCGGKTYNGDHGNGGSGGNGNGGTANGGSSGGHGGLTTCGAGGDGGGGASQSANGGGANGGDYYRAFHGCTTGTHGGSGGSGTVGGNGGDGYYYGTIPSDGGGGGGGGGGGYFGGGGGGGGEYAGGGGGGGGGSNGWDANSFVPADSSQDSNSGAGSVSFDYAVQATSTTLAAQSATVYAGGKQTITANVSPSTATSTVAFTLNGNAVACDGGLPNVTNGKAVCTFTDSTNPHGSSVTETVVGYYGGDGGDRPSQNSVTYTLQPGPTSTSIISFRPSDPNTVPITVQVTPQQSTTTIDGTFDVTTTPASTGCSNVSLASAQPGQATTGTCTLANLTAGATYTVHAAYRGSDTTAASASTVDRTVTLSPEPTTTDISLAPAAGTFGDAVTITGTLSGVGGTTPAGGSMEIVSVPSATAAGDPIDSPTTVCPATPVTTVNGQPGVSCTVTPDAGTSNYLASYVGDAATAASHSASTAYTPGKADTSTTLAITGATLGANGYRSTSGDALGFSGSVSYATGGYQGKNVPGATVRLLEGTTVLCASLPCNLSDLAPGAHILTASYAGSAGANPSTSADSKLVISVADAKVTLTGPGQQQPAGRPITLTATLDTTADSAGGGTMSFYDLADPTHALCAVTLPASRTATCDTTPTPGAAVRYQAIYTDDPITGDVNSLLVDYQAAAATSTTALTSSPEAPVFGQPVTLVATVTSQQTTPRATPDGSVTFTVGRTVLCPAVAVVPSATAGVATATCATSNLPSGDTSITASYSATPATAASTDTETVSVAGAPTTTTLTLVNTTTDVDAAVTVSATGAVPRGSVAVHDATATGAVACTIAALGANGDGSCHFPLPGKGTHTYVAVFTPAGGDFLSSSATTDDEVGDANEPCDAGFATLFAKASAARTQTIDAPGSLGSVTATFTAVPGSCTQATVLPFTASATLFGTSLTGSGITGVASQTGGLCLTSGALGLPDAYHAGALRITAPICFGLTDAGGLGTLRDGGSIAAGSSATTPFFNVPGIGTVTLTLTAGHDADGAATLSIATSVTGKSASASMSAVIAADGSVTGSLETAGLTVFDQPLELSGDFSRTTDGTLSSHVTATLDGPLPLVTGVALHDIIATLGTDGLSVGGKADLGAGDDPATIDFAGDFTSLTNWTITVDATAPAWTPVSGLTVTPHFEGTITDTDGEYDYDLTASGTPLASWMPGPGIAIIVDSITVSNGATDCGSGDPVLSVAGAVTAGPVTTTLAGCVNLRSRDFRLTGSVDSAEIASGLTLTGVTATIIKAGRAVTFAGKGTGTVTAGGKTITSTFAVRITSDGTVVVGASVDLNPLGLPVEGYIAYASDDVEDFDTGDDSLPGGADIALPAGLSARGVITFDGAVGQTLSQAGFTAGSEIAFEAALSPTGELAFKAELSAPGDMPFLTLPGGSTLDSASIEYEGGTLTIDAEASVAQGADPPAKASLSLTVNSTDGSFSGTGSLTGLVLLGQNIDLSGSVSKPAGGKVSASITATLPGPIALASTVALSDVTVTLGTEGVSFAGSVSIADSARVDVEGELSSLTDWRLSVSGDTGPWTPTQGVTLDAVISGTIAHSGKSTTIDVSATGKDGAPLFTISPNSAVSVGVTSIAVGNDTAPAGCVKTAGDVYFAVGGSLSLSLGQASGSVTASGCFDLTTPRFQLSAAIPSLSVSLLGGSVGISNLTVSLARTAAGFTANAQGTLAVNLPSGGQISFTGQLYFAGGVFAIGASVNLSKYLGATGASAYLYYASAPITLTVPDPTIGTVKLAAGVTVALDLQLDDDQSKLLAKIGLDAPSGVKLKALGNLDFVSRTLTLDVSVDFGAEGATIFGTRGDSSNPYMTFLSGGLQLTISPTIVSLGIRADTELYLPAATPGGQPSQVELTGLLAITDDQISVSLTARDWQDAFGIQGLDLSYLAVQAAIDFEGLPSFGFAASVDGLPDGVASAIGYTQGAPITVALNLSADEFLLDVEIGTRDSGITALAPLTAFGAPDLIKVDFARLYISPLGAKIGTQVFQPGFEIALQASIDGVSLDIDARVDPVKIALYFKADIGVITIGSLTLGPTHVLLDASVADKKFDFEFSGSISLGPGEVQIGPLLRIGGSASGDVDIKIGTSGLSVHGDFDVSVYSSDYLPQKACYYAGFIPYPCDYQWVDTKPVDFHLDNLGFSVDSSGVTIDVPNTTSSITLPFPGGGSSAAVSPRPGIAAARPAVHPAGLRVGHHAGHRVGHRIGHPARHHAGHRAGHRIGLPLVASETGRTSGTSHTPHAAGRWQPTGSLGHGRSFAATATLPDGRVLVAGGASGATALDTAEVYDPSTGAWHATAAMPTGVVGATATVLTDGRVLVAGGATASGPSRVAQVYDPSTGAWSVADPMGEARQGATATLLPDGRVLLAGGRTSTGDMTATAELFDPATGHWSTTGAMPAGRSFASAAPLADGMVLVAGGIGSAGPLRSAALYSPASGTWTSVGSLRAARFGASLVPVAGGSVLAVGGTSETERYVPARRAFVPAGLQSTPQVFAAAVRLADGRVLAAGGFAGPRASAVAQLYSARAGSWSNVRYVPGARAGASAALLPTGAVLLAGGTGVGVTVPPQTTSEQFVVPASRPAPNPPGPPLAHTGPVAALGVWIPVGSGLLLLGVFLALAGRRRRRF